MEVIDWIVLLGTLAFIVIYGALKTKGAKNMDSYVRGGSKTKWWTIGLSVMATQASAITFLSTTGQAYHSGMGFVQFYFGLPIAMVIICLVFIPIYHKLKVYTAYEYLEGRFDLKTRTLAAILFLVQRGLAAGITIFAPSIILSSVLGWNVYMLNLIIGVLVIIYTVSGGTKAVSVTQKQQMFVIMAGMFAAFFIAIDLLPEEVTFSKALDIAGLNERMNIVNWSFDLNERYTMWTALTGSVFLMLSYFGTDQSQVQRYLGGKSVRESQMGLLFNGFLKIPMQFFILLVGIVVFVLFQYQQVPLTFNPAAEKAIVNSEYADEYAGMQVEYDAVRQEKRAMQDAWALSPSSSDVGIDEGKFGHLSKREVELQEETKALILKADPDVQTNDKDYVFLHFILNYLPRGLIGLLLAVILSAAMSSTASELNALASTTAIDLYKRNKKTEPSETHMVKASKWLTVIWGGIAILFACYGTLFENLIQLVNIIGSIFYGTILGIFVVGFFLKYVRGNAIFWAACISETLVISIFTFSDIGYLWLNFIGCFLTVVIALVLQTTAGSKSKKISEA